MLSAEGTFLWLSTRMEETSTVICQKHDKPSAVRRRCGVNLKFKVVCKHATSKHDFFFCDCASVVQPCRVCILGCRNQPHTCRHQGHMAGILHVGLQTVAQTVGWLTEAKA